MQSSEESWVQGPALAYRRQDHLLLLATGSFLTRTHAAAAAVDAAGGRHGCSLWIPPGAGRSGRISRGPEAAAGIDSPWPLLTLRWKNSRRARKTWPWRRPSTWSWRRPTESRPRW